MLNTLRVDLKLENLQQNILMAFHDCQLELNEMVKVEVLRACNTEQLKYQVEVATRQAVEHAIKDSINNYFRYGEGKSFIKQAAEKRLAEIIDDMGLNDE